MAKRLTQDALSDAYKLLYAKISSVTAEDNGKKRIFNGTLKSLFSEVPVSSYIITRFIWAIAHKTNVLPTVLFSVKKNGRDGVIVERLHSGFYNDKGRHVIGNELVPFIMKSASLYQPKRNNAKSSTSKPVQEVSVPTKLPEYAKLPASPDQLTDAELDIAIQELQATLNAFMVEKKIRAEIVAKKRELFKTVSELVESEGFTLDEIMQIV